MLMEELRDTDFWPFLVLFCIEQDKVANEFLYITDIWGRPTSGVLQLIM